jgi:hypothetical protein
MIVTMMWLIIAMFPESDILTMLNCISDISVMTLSLNNYDL